ncbi:MAG TPA: acyltransferase [Candidatus Thermoplasmatota archaeon]|nr:acyltransferase [Candidatus Thermoplasmatota archaeon]
MTRATTRHPSKGPANSLWYWVESVGFWKTVRNYVLMVLARISPSLRFKHVLYRAMGAKIGAKASIGLEVTFDVFFPELIEIGENSIVGYNTTILCHEFLVDEYRTGRVKIGRNVTIGANCTILPGVTIADGSVVSAMSLVNRDVDGFVGGVPARPLAKR